jgi:hypothetical protein
MRQKQTSIKGDGESVGYTFHFQVANGGARRACCVRVDASNMQEATALFRRKWSLIESMARDGHITGVTDDSAITFVTP